MNKLNYKLINLCILIITIYFLYKTNVIWVGIGNILKQILFPFLISFFLAYVLYFFTKYLRKRGINHFFSSLIVVSITVFLIFILVYFSFPIIAKELIDLSSLILSYADNVWQNNSGLLGDYLMPSIKDFLFNLGDIIYKYGLGFITRSVSYVSKIIIVLILTVYFLFNMENIKIKLRFWFAKKNYFDLLKDVDDDLNNYIKSVSMIMFIESCEYFLLYFIIGHPNFLLLGILAGFATIIPYFGSLFTSLIALLTSIRVSRNLFIMTAIISIVVPIFDSYVIDPKIYHKTVKISPIKAISAMVICNTLFDFLGVVIAIPLYIVIEKTIKKILWDKKKSKN